MKKKWKQMKVITWYHDLSYLEGKVNLILDILDNVPLHPCMVTCIQHASENGGVQYMKPLLSV